MQGPQITTIIPTFRRPKKLRRAIRSVLAQTYPHFRVMVLDNASGDETPEVVAEFAREDPRVHYHCQAENIGALGNFDYGMHHVETPFFCFLSDDDLVLPRFYETAMKGFDDCPVAMFSVGLTVYADPDRPIDQAYMVDCRAGRHDPPDGALDMLRLGCPIWTGIVFRKVVMQHVGYLAPNVVTADTEFTIRIAMRFPFVSSLRLCAFALRHEGSFSETRGVNFLWPNWPNMIASLMRVDGVDAAAKREIRSMMLRSLRRRLVGFALRETLTGNYDEASEAAAILRVHLGGEASGLVLGAAARVASIVPGVTKLLRLLQRLRRSYRWLGDRRVIASGGWDGLAETKHWLHRIRDMEC